MNKIYYSGEILNLNDLLNISFDLGDMEHVGYSSVLTDKFLEYLNSLKREKKDKFIKLIKNYYPNDIIRLHTQEWSDIKNTINHAFSVIHNQDNGKSISILYELITSENGDLYGKELLTGFVFPIVNNDKIEYKLSISNVKNAVLSDDGELLFVKTRDKYYHNHKDYRCLNYSHQHMIYFIESINSFTDRNKKKFYPINLTVYSLKPIIHPFENLSLCDSIIFNHKVANKNELEEYTEKFKGLFKKNSKKAFIESITKQYNKNIFNSEIKEKEPIQEEKKEKIEKDKLTLKLENIEYLLAKLKRKDNTSYETCLKEYNNLINSETEILTLTPITLESLTILEGKIEFCLNYSKNKNIFDLLDDLKNEYLDNFQNKEDRTTKLALTEIDKLYELFSKARKEYSLKDQTKILKDIAFLYIMETIEDNDIDITDLENSYFSDHLKYIMMVILSLIDDNTIKDNIFINLEDELNIQNIYNIIKNIEFKNNKQKRKK